MTWWGRLNERLTRIFLTTLLNSVRRGFQVYREVCASCHAMEHTYFRNLVDVTHSEEEVKKIAESYDVVDGPNAEGVRFYLFFLLVRCLDFWGLRSMDRPWVD